MRNGYFHDANFDEWMEWNRKYVSSFVISIARNCSKRGERFFMLIVSEDIKLLSRVTAARENEEKKNNNNKSNIEVSAIQENKMYTKTHTKKNFT